jgi:uncharacterized protein YbbC (DUF1343 family)
MTVRNLFFTILVLLAGLPVQGQPLRTRTGADLLVTRYTALIKGKRIGLVINHTSLLSDGRHLVEAILQDSLASVVALFSPEHGIRGKADDSVDNQLDTATGLVVHSLYGRNRKPTPESLAGVDLLIYDLQDVGARFYTYATTLGLVMESAAENGKPIIVLDRPNPIAGMAPDGPVLEDSLKSFVGYASVPIVHNMTVGELAKFYNGEGCLARKARANLTVVAMENWTHTTRFESTGLRWVKPSPNMLSVATAFAYPGTCLLEGTNVSEGRGSEKPFEYVGAPWLNSAQVIDLLEKARLPGVEFESVQFVPVSRGAAVKYSNQGCNGIYLRVMDRATYEPVKVGVLLLWAIRKVHPDRLEWRVPGLDRLCGSGIVREMIDAGEPPQMIFARWRPGVERFAELRKKYLLYD